MIQNLLAKRGRRDERQAAVPDPARPGERPDRAATQGGGPNDDLSIGESITTRTSAYVTSLDEPVLETPTSQTWTARQCDEPAFRLWMRTLKLRGDVPMVDWKAAYVLQALGGYGALQPDAEILGFGGTSQPIAAYLASRGCSVMATDGAVRKDAPGAPGRMIEAMQRPDVCPPDRFRERVDYTICRPTAILPILRNRFDALWSFDLDQQLDHGELLRFVANCMTCLRPGGLAVHVFAEARQDADEFAAHGLHRGLIERMALDALSNLHDVAQLKFRAGGVRRGPDEAAPFGLVIRKSA